MTKLPNRKWEFSKICYCGKCRFTGKRSCPEKGLGRKGVKLYTSREWTLEDFTASQAVLKELKR